LAHKKDIWLRKRQPQQMQRGSSKKTSDEK
jgi:hypothetical protein